MRGLLAVLLLIVLVLAVVYVGSDPIANRVDLERELWSILDRAQDFADRGSVEAAHIGAYHLAARYPFTFSAVRARAMMFDLREPLDRLQARRASALQTRDRGTRTLKPTLDLLPLVLLGASLILWMVALCRSRRGRGRLAGWHVLLATGYTLAMFVGLGDAAVAEQAWLVGSVVSWALLLAAAMAVGVAIPWGLATRVCAPVCGRRVKPDSLGALGRQSPATTSRATRWQIVKPM